MKHLILTCLLVILAATPAAASQTFRFTYSGQAYVDPYDGSTTLRTDTLVQGTMVLDTVYLNLNAPNNWDPSRSIINTTVFADDRLVQSLTLEVATAGNPTASYSLAAGDIGAVVLDLSQLELASLPVNVNLVGLPTTSGFDWGFVSPDVGVSGNSDGVPTAAVNGNFAIFAPAGYTGTGPTAIYPFQLGTDNGNGDPVQLTSFQATPEPSTCLLLAVSLGVVGYARKRMGKG